MGGQVNEKHLSSLCAQLKLVWLVGWLVGWFVRSFVGSFVRWFVRSFVRSFVCLFVRSFKISPSICGKVQISG